MPQFIGFSFPFRKGAASFPEVATDDDLIKQSLIQLVLTGRGERIMRPDVGSLALTYLFESEDELLLQRAQHDLTNLISKYEPRVALRNISVVRGDVTKANGPATIVITIQYIVLKTGTNGTTTLTVGTGNG